LVLLVHKVIRVQQAHKARQVQQAQSVHKGQQVQLAPLAQLVRKVLLVPLVHQEQQVHKAREELGWFRGHISHWPLQHPHRRDLL
jgi:hypothetical protein